MHARRRNNIENEESSVALIVGDPQQAAAQSSSHIIVADADETKKYSAAPSSTSSWSLGGYLPTKLTQAVYSPLQQLQDSTPVRFLLDPLNTGPVLQQQRQANNQQLLPPKQQHQQPQQQQRTTSYLNGLPSVNNDKHSDDSSDESAPIEIEVMASRDRTLEFSNAIRSMQSRHIARAVNVRDAKKATQLQSYAEFMQIAKHVGKNIASTYTKLEKLTLCE